MPVTIDGTTGITTPTYNGSVAAEYIVPVTSMKNRIINGNVTVDQRGATVTIPAYTNTYGPDRWFGYGQPNASKFSLAKGNTSGAAQAAGFNNCLVATSLSAYSISSSDIQFMGQRIEGFNVADLQWGTANAKTVTLSFWAFSSITGTWGGAIVDSVNAYNYPFTYTISSAFTWEYKTVTIVGPTSGTWSSTTGIGMGVLFSIGTGSSFVATAGAWTSSANIFGATGQNSLLGTNGAQLIITGVQLEAGSTATSFDFRDCGTELFLCQRYYEQMYAQTQFFVPNSSYLTYGINMWQFRVPKRAAPTLSAISGASITMDRFGIGAPTVTSSGIDSGTQYSARAFVVYNTGYSVGEGITLTSTYWQASAEL